MLGPNFETSKVNNEVRNIGSLDTFKGAFGKMPRGFYSF